MKSIYLYNKKQGENTSQCIKRLRNDFPELINQKVGHLGTLDPMAAGLMVFLAGSATKDFLKLQKLHKIYNSIFLLGLKTDSYDLLGLPEITDIQKSFALTDKNIEAALKKFTGKIEQTPPVFSSIIIKGHPLFWWYKNNKKIEIKSRFREVFNINIKNIYLLDIAKLKKHIAKIDNVEGDFRQVEILNEWAKLVSQVEKSGVEKLKVIDLNIECSSGTYVRTIANDLGKVLECGAFALEINRTQIGEYNLT